MKNRIQKKFQELQAKGKKAFVAFITAGDPNLKTTAQIIPRLERAGVDILELGVPFSDPMADGPVIQRSSERALKAGTTLGKILDLVRQARRQSELPILLMGYYNPILTFGVERFFEQARRAGVDGALIVDLPPEEGERARQAAVKAGISLIFLLAPTSNPDRIRRVHRKGSGFLYYVSLTGITGASLSTQLGKQQALKNIKKISKLPVCVGFGIKKPEQAKQVARLADGVVVGSALVQTLEKHPGAGGLRALEKQTAGLARAVHSL